MRPIRVGKGKVTGNKFTPSQTYVAGQSCKVLEARAKKQEAAWLKKNRSSKISSK